MARALRLEYPGAVYHVMARGNQGQDIFQDEACEKSGWVVHSYVLMSNHYHLLLETPEANLVAGMKWLGERTVGDGTLYAGDASDQPDEAASWTKARATAAQTAEAGVKGKAHEQINCHNFGTLWCPRLTA